MNILIQTNTVTLKKAYLDEKSGRFTLPDNSKSSKADAYNKTVDKKVTATFKENLPVIAALAVLTLPIFFVAWPMGYMAILDGAKAELKASKCVEYIEFENNLAEHLRNSKENDDSDLIDMAKAYIENDANGYKKLFGNRDKFLVISIALRIMRGELVKPEYRTKDAVDTWINLSEKSQKDVKKYAKGLTVIDEIIGIYKRQGIELNREEVKRLISQTKLKEKAYLFKLSDNLELWNKKTTNDKMTNDEILNTIVRKHGIPLYALNKISEAVIKKRGSNINGIDKRIDAHASARREILTLIETRPWFNAITWKIDDRNADIFEMIYFIVNTYKLNNKDNLKMVNESLRDTLELSGNILPPIKALASRICSLFFDWMSGEIINRSMFIKRVEGEINNFKDNFKENRQSHHLHKEFPNFIIQEADRELYKYKIIDNTELTYEADSSCSIAGIEIQANWDANIHKPIIKEKIDGHLEALNQITDRIAEKTKMTAETKNELKIQSQMAVTQKYQSLYTSTAMRFLTSTGNTYYRIDDGQKKESEGFKYFTKDNKINDNNPNCAIVNFEYVEESNKLKITTNTKYNISALRDCGDRENESTTEPTSMYINQVTQMTLDVTAADFNPQFEILAIYPTIEDMPEIRAETSNREEINLFNDSRFTDDIDVI